ncbi:cation:proton antiporter [Streptosporangium subroseum]|uniref:cation:proton antiporter n=1 Tax=Streptosporangium subroseum TaxID=106412 RepID=UPI003089F9C8|nr:cation:proton antiporter [Streptosporangium subroseum]
MTAPGAAAGRVRWTLLLGLAALAGGLMLGVSAAIRQGDPGFAVDPVTRFLLAVALILIVSHLLGELMRWIGQPPVLGEIIGGIVIGKSVFGLLWPEAGAWVFQPDVLDSLNKIAQLGLVVFMFLLGCELRTDRIERRSTVAALVTGGTILPLVAGMGIAFLARSQFQGTSTSGTYVLYFGLAMAITAVPVLARILVDLKLEHTRVGVLALSSAAAADGVAWVLLTLILADRSGALAQNVGYAVALVAFMMVCVRPALAALVPRIRAERLLMMVLVTGAIAFAGLTQLMHLHPVVGAFLFGVAVPRDSPIVERISQQLQGFTLMVLLPLFFTGVGLSMSIGLLGSDAGHWLLFLAVLVVALLTKVVGTWAAARGAGLPRHEALQLGALMNCRGVTEIVVASIGLQAGVINELAFTILVLVAVVTTAMTKPIMLRLLSDRPVPVPSVGAART